MSREGASSLRGGMGRTGRQGMCGMQVCLPGGDEVFSSLCDTSSKIWCSLPSLPLDCRTATVAQNFLSVPTHCLGTEQFLLHPRLVGHQGVRDLVGRAYLLQGLGVTGTCVADVILSVPPASFQFTWYLLPYLCFQ